MKRLLSMLNVIGFALMLFALTFFVPMAVAAWLDDGTLPAFLEGFLIALVMGAIPYFFTRSHQRELQARDGFLLVVLVWTVLPLVATLPLLLYFESQGTPLSFSLAYFETMSGLTTTGATVLSGLDSLPPAINVWRSTLMWLGGMGILVLAVAILPLLGVGGSQVIRAETPGPMKDEKLTPRIASTAKGLYLVYLGISAVCWTAYWLAGMSAVDAYIHMASTVSLGGFSSYDASFAAFNSPVIEAVAMVFMVVCGLSFATHFNAWRGKSMMTYWRCPEAKYVVALLLGAGLLISAYLFFSGAYANPLSALRYGMFNTISVATTTGYANTDYAAWPVFAPLFMLLLSCFTASSGSTGSGIKFLRLRLLIQQTRLELRRVLHPRIVAPIQLSHRVVDSRVLLALLAFLVLYAGTIFAISLLLLLTGLDPATALSAALASVNNLGPGLGGVGPASNFSVLEPAQVWLCTVGMLLGRLELVTVLVLLTPGFWRH